MQKLLAGITFLSCLQLGCLPDQRKCDEDLAVDDRLTIDIGARESDIRPCDPALGIAPERRLEVTITDFGGTAGCAAAIVMVDSLDDWEVTRRDQETKGSRLVEAHYRLARGECSGSLHLIVKPPGTSVPTPPLDAENAAKLDVSYLADRDLTDCPLSCDDTYRVQVQRQ
jgi:hypothetical protein